MSIFSGFWKKLKNNLIGRGTARTVLLSRRTAIINVTAFGIYTRETILVDAAGDKATRSVIVSEELDSRAAAVCDHEANTIDAGLDAVHLRIWKSYGIRRAVHAPANRRKLKIKLRHRQNTRYDEEL